MTWESLTLTWHYVEKWAKAKPDAEALVFEDERLTWSDFKTRIDMISKAFLAAGVEKGASEAGREIVGTISHQQLREIAELKMKDLNAIDIEGAERQIMGTARSMGIKLAD